MNPVTRCPDIQTLQRVLESSGDEPDDALWLDHIETCTHCLEAADQFPEQWSLHNLACCAHQSLSPENASLLKRLAAKPPSQHAAPAPPALQGTPEIAGITDLVAIGQGGMSVVYRAIETKLNRPVAVKLLQLLGPAARQRAEREAQTLAKLEHPNIVRIYGTGEAGNTPYLVMEWVSGGTLQKLIEKGTLDSAFAASLVRDLAKAMAEVHALEIIHRDLKPDNVLLAPSKEPGQPYIPKLADFGLARPDDQGPGLTENGMVVGTPSYMAPEQTGRNPGLVPVGIAADIHGLGAILYATLTGNAPYHADTPQQSYQLAAQGAFPSLVTACPDVPLDLRTIAEKCLQHDPARRYLSANELAEDLTRFLEGKPILARPVSVIGRISKWARRRPITAATSLLLLLASLAGLVGTAYHQHRMTRSHNDLINAHANSQRALMKLSDDSVERLIKRGSPLNASDAQYLRQIRDEYLQIPIDPDPGAALISRGLGLRRLSLIFWEIDQYDDAYICAQASLAEFEKALAYDPNIRGIAHMRLIALMSLHTSLIRTQRYEEREQISRKLIQELERLVVEKPTYRSDLAQSLINLGIDLAETGRFDEAATNAAQANLLYETLRQETPDDEPTWYNEQMALYNTALCFERAGQPEQKEALLQKMASLSQQAIERFPTNPLNYINNERMALTELANTYLSQKRTTEARTTVERIKKLCQTSRKDHPDKNLTVGFDQGLIEAAGLEYEICKLEQRPGDALPALQKAIALARRYREQEPAIFDRSRALMLILGQRADLLEQTHELEEASRQYEEVLAIAQSWLELKDRTTEIQGFIKTSLDRLIELTTLQGNHAQAARWIQDRIQISQPDEQPSLLLKLAEAEHAAAK